MECLVLVDFDYLWLSAWKFSIQENAYKRQGGYRLVKHEFLRQPGLITEKFMFCH